MEQTAGKQSISFIEPVHIISSASVVGPKEGEGPLGDGFDLIAPEADFGEETWEQAESTMQQEAPGFQRMSIWSRVPSTQAWKMSIRSVSSMDKRGWVSGSPKRALYSTTFGPS